MQKLRFLWSVCSFDSILIFSWPKMTRYFPQTKVLCICSEKLINFIWFSVFAAGNYRFQLLSLLQNSFCILPPRKLDSHFAIVLIAATVTSLRALGLIMMSIVAEISSHTFCSWESPGIKIILIHFSLEYCPFLQLSLSSYSNLTCMEKLTVLETACLDSIPITI